MVNRNNKKRSPFCRALETCYKLSWKQKTTLNKDLRYLMEYKCNKNIVNTGKHGPNYCSRDLIFFSKYQDSAFTGVLGLCFDIGRMLLAKVRTSHVNIIILIFIIPFKVFMNSSRYSTAGLAYVDTDRNLMNTFLISTLALLGL